MGIVSPQTNATAAKSTTTNTSAEGTRANITGWASFNFGMHYDEVLKIIQEKTIPWIKLKSKQFSEIEEERESYLVTIYPTDFLKEGHFQFNKDNQLYLIRFVFDEKHFSFLSLMKQLTDKYGPPNKTTHQRVEWNKDDSFLQLQRNRTVRYFKTSIFQKTKLPENQAQTLIKESVESILRSL